MVLGLPVANPTRLEFRLQSGFTTDDLNNRVPQYSSLFVEVEMVPTRDPSVTLEPGVDTEQYPMKCRVLNNNGTLPRQILQMNRPTATATYQERIGKFKVTRFQVPTVTIGGHSGDRILGIWMPD